MRMLTKGKRFPTKAQSGTGCGFSRHTGTERDGTGTSGNSAKCTYRAFDLSPSRFSSSDSIASRMKMAIRLGPAIASILARVSASNLTRVGFVSTSFFSGGRPMRLAVSDCGNSVKAAS